MDSSRLDIEQASAVLGVSSATVRNWSNAGLLSKQKLGRKLVYQLSELEQLKKDIASGKIQRLQQRANKKAKTGSRTHKELGDKQSIALIQQVCHQLSTLKLSHYQILSTLGIILFRRNKQQSHIEQLQLTTKVNQQLLEELQHLLPDNSHIDILGIAYQHLRSDGNKAQAGAIYTPLWVAKRQIQTHLKQGDNFLDPCCGTGSYLLVAIRHLKELGVKKWWSQIYGADIDELAVLCARINCQLEIPADEQASVTIRCCNSLLERETIASMAPHFDLIASNPPWGVHFSQQELNKLVKHAPHIKSKESFAYFIDLAFKLLQGEGKLSYLLPESICHIGQHRDTRKQVLTSGLSSINAYKNLFKGLMTDVVQLDIDVANKPQQVDIITEKESYQIPVSQFKESLDFTFDFYMHPKDFAIVQQIEQKDHRCLKAHASWALGIVTGNNMAFLASSPAQSYEPIYRGKHIQPYSLSKSDEYIAFQPQQYQQCAKPELYRAPQKLIYRFIADRLVVAFDDKQSLSLNSANILIPDESFNIKYVLAALNADYASFYFKKRFHAIKVLRKHLEHIPIPTLPKDKELQVIAHVDEILSCSDTKDEKKAYHREEINRLFNQSLGIKL